MLLLGKWKWYKLPSTQHNHQFLPSIWVYRDAKINPNGCGILLCAGINVTFKPLNDRTYTQYHIDNLIVFFYSFVHNIILQY